MQPNIATPPNGSAGTVLNQAITTLKRQKIAHRKGAVSGGLPLLQIQECHGLYN